MFSRLKSLSLIIVADTLIISERLPFGIGIYRINDVAMDFKLWNCDFEPNVSALYIS